MNKSRLLRFMAVAVIAALSCNPITASAQAKKLTVLGTDASNDGPPAVDLTYLAVGRDDDRLHVRFGVNGLVPVQNSYPKAGIEWTFSSGGRTFIAEGHPDVGAQFFTLYQVQGDTFNQVATLDGRFDPANGYMELWIPLSDIGARKGSRISGTGADDVDVHQHAGPASPVVDSMDTTKTYTVR